MIDLADISVVIPCYNHSNILRRTLEGLVRQTLKPKEVFIVDDGSNDEPEGIVNDFKSKLNITFNKLDHNHGAPVARNTGARLASGTYIIFLDADAELMPDALETLRSELEAHPEASFAFSDFLWGTKRFRGQAFDFDELKKRNYIHTSSLIRRADMVEFDEILKKFQDWDLWLTMAERGKTGVWINRVLYRIQPRRQGMSRWLPKIAYWIPWQRLGFEPKEITHYRDAELIVRKKHRI